MMKPNISRRAFLAGGALSASALLLHSQAAAKQIHGSVSSTSHAPVMPFNFPGLSYEVQQLVSPDFFSGANAGLIHAFRDLAPKGVLRIGGNTSEFAYWKPTADSPEPLHPVTREVTGEPRAQYYPVTPLAVRNLRDFLEATNWTCIYGIGMGTNTPDRAADEAEFVYKTLGQRLEYFQVGNEADLFSSHLRDPHTWSAEIWLQEWLALAQAIAARVPHAQFGIPDVASDLSWLTRIAQLWPSVNNAPRVVILSHHYYFNGPATNPDVNIPNLLRRETMQRVAKSADLATAAAASMHLRVRMTEGNTCYRGGKPGLSDVFASSLWAADYALYLATRGYTGLNLHGGTGKSVANSVGGVLPGDLMLKEAGAGEQEIASHPHPFYTPIATFGADYRLQPVALGLKFASLLCGGRIALAGLDEAFALANVNASAYSAEMPSGQKALLILNKDADQDLQIHLEFPGLKDAVAEAKILHATSLQSREASISSVPGKQRIRNGRYTAQLPRASGICLLIA